MANLSVYYETEINRSHTLILNAISFTFHIFFFLELNPSGTYYYKQHFIFSYQWLDAASVHPPSLTQLAKFAAPSCGRTAWQIHLYEGSQVQRIHPATNRRTERFPLIFLSTDIFHLFVVVVFKWDGVTVKHQLFIPRALSCAYKQPQYLR